MTPNNDNRPDNIVALKPMGICATAYYNNGNLVNLTFKNVININGKSFTELNMDEKEERDVLKTIQIPLSLPELKRNELLVYGKVTVGHSRNNGSNITTESIKQEIEERLANAQKEKNVPLHSRTELVAFIPVLLLSLKTPIDTPERFPYPYGPNAPGNFLDSYQEQLIWFKEQGFLAIPYKTVCDKKDGDRKSKELEHLIERKFYNVTMCHEYPFDRVMNFY